MTKKFAPVCILWVFACAPAFAEPGGWLAVGAGQADTDFSASDLDDGSFVSAKVDTKDISMRISGGYSVNDHLALEVGYIDTGEISISAQSDGSGPIYPAGLLNAGATMTGFLLGVNGYLPLNAKSRLVGRFGILGWDIEAAASMNGVAASTTDSGNDPYLGIGIEGDVGSSLTFGANYTRYDEVDVDVIELGVRFRFGH